MSENSTIQTLSDSDPISDPIEILPGHDGFFSVLRFNAAITATIRYHFAATKNGLYVVDPSLDDDVLTQGPHAADIYTNAKWVRVEVVTASPFTADLQVARG